MARPPWRTRRANGGACHGASHATYPDRVGVSAPRTRLSNLPVDVTSFVNRRTELAEIRHLLSIARLVTLTGPGGVGKTRLALRAAASVHRTFPDGVWFVELATLKDSALITETVGSALGIRDQSARPLLDVLREQLADKHLLLVMDNCEHLLDETANVVETLLRAAPKLWILATSRQALRASGEHVLVVPSLSVPDPGEQVTVDDLPRYHAVSLFTERARAILPDFTVTAENAETIAQLCRRLDGLPLALELAVVRLRGLAPEQILARLDHSFQLLTSGDRTAEPRQATLRALIDWSYDLCSPAEQTLWTRLSVFSGGFDLEAVEEVCSGDDISRETVLELLLGLVDKSILVREEYQGRAWYRLLSLVREYGREHLDGGAEEKISHRHLDYYQRLAERAEAEWFGPDQVEWCDRLRRELPNLRTALEFSCTHPEWASSGLRICAALRIYWIGTGSLSEGRRWLDRLLESSHEPSPERGKALWVKSWLACLQSDMAAAVPPLEQARGLAERFDDAVALAYVARISGLIAIFEGDLSAARGHFEEALVRHRNTDDPIGIVHAVARLASIAIFRGDTDRALSLCEESLAISDARGEQWGRSYTLWILGIALWQKGDMVRATAVERESLRIKGLFNDMLGTGNVMEALAWIAATGRDGKRAGTLLGAAERIWQSNGLSLYAYLRGFHDACVEHARESLGSQAYQAAFEHGMQWSLESAIAYALSETSKTTTKAASGSGPHEATPLTRREEQIAELVANGLSNREIATKLVISQRTVEAHVEHILTKLGFTSRAQVAAWLARR